MAVADFEQQNKILLTELNFLKVSLRCLNISGANVKVNTDRAEVNLEISDTVTSDLFEENTNIRQQLPEATYRAASLQSEILESNKMNFLPKQKLDDYDLSNRRFNDFSAEKTNQIKDQTEIKPLVKQVQVMREGVVIQRVAAIQLFKADDSQQYMRLEKCLHALLAHAGQRELDQYTKYSIFNIQNEMLKTASQYKPPFFYPVVYNFDKIPTGGRIIFGVFGQKNPRRYPLAKNSRKTPKRINSSIYIAQNSDISVALLFVFNRFFESYNIHLQQLNNLFLFFILRLKIICIF